MELKAFDIVVAEEGYCEGIVKYRRAVYDESEADKVIAELKVDYKEACDRLQTANLIKDEQMAKVAKQKRKRCMAMAEFCNSEMRVEIYRCFGVRDLKQVWKEETGFWKKWRKIWFELYKKFKEADDGND